MPRSLRILFACSFLIPLASPMIQQACPSGAPIGTFQLTATPPEGGVARPIETVNQLLPKDTIWYEPAALSAADKKKARIALVLVPSDSSKVLVLPPKPAGDPLSWTVPSATQIVAVVWGPHGLEDSKVKGLVKKNSDLIGELADYAQKTEQTQNLIQAITQQQQSLLTGENLDTAVVSFASSFPGAPQIDRTQPANQQMLALLRSVNPALSSYDPLAPSAAQRTEQSAGLAAAVAGMYFGNTEVGLAAAGGALLVNMHAIFFPRTEFRSAFAQTPPEHPTETEL
ncbi:MAG TPA: hypothetical protein VJ732_20380, partial [Bryobacteraceae bacterium]|nr:hypothetical protein [Bryobacteraceae bacterium]